MNARRVPQEEPGRSCQTPAWLLGSRLLRLEPSANRINGTKDLELRVIQPIDPHRALSAEDRGSLR